MKRKKVSRRKVGFGTTSPIMKRMKIHAQRKFAQGSNNFSYAKKEPPKRERYNSFSSSCTSDCEIDSEGEKPYTEDFLTFLCYRGTECLPEKLNFFSVPQKKMSKKTSLIKKNPPDIPIQFKHDYVDEAELKKMMFSPQVVLTPITAIPEKIIEKKEVPTVKKEKTAPPSGKKPKNYVTCLLPTRNIFLEEEERIKATLSEGRTLRSHPRKQFSDPSKCSFSQPQPPIVQIEEYRNNSLPEEILTECLKSPVKDQISDITSVSCATNHEVPNPSDTSIHLKTELPIISERSDTQSLHSNSKISPSIPSKINSLVLPSSTSNIIPTLPSSTVGSMLPPSTVRPMICPSNSKPVQSFLNNIVTISSNSKIEHVSTSSNIKLFSDLSNAKMNIKPWPIVSSICSPTNITPISSLADIKLVSTVSSYCSPAKIYPVSTLADIKIIPTSNNNNSVSTIISDIKPLSTPTKVKPDNIKPISSTSNLKTVLSSSNILASSSSVNKSSSSTPNTKLMSQSSNIKTFLSSSNINPVLPPLRQIMSSANIKLMEPPSSSIKPFLSPSKIKPPVSSSSNIKPIPSTTTPSNVKPSASFSNIKLLSKPAATSSNINFLSTPSKTYKQPLTTSNEILFTTTSTSNIKPLPASPLMKSASSLSNMKIIPSTSNIKSLLLVSNVKLLPSSTVTPNINFLQQPTDVKSLAFTQITNNKSSPITSNVKSVTNKSCPIKQQSSNVLCTSKRTNTTATPASSLNLYQTSYLALKPEEFLYVPRSARKTSINVTPPSSEFKLDNQRSDLVDIREDKMKIVKTAVKEASPLVVTEKSVCGLEKKTDNSKIEKSIRTVKTDIIDKPTHTPDKPEDNVKIEKSIQTPDKHANTAKKGVDNVPKKSFSDPQLITRSSQYSTRSNLNFAQTSTSKNSKNSSGVTAKLTSINKPADITVKRRFSSPSTRSSTLRETAAMSAKKAKIGQNVKNQSSKSIQFTSPKPGDISEAPTFYPTEDEFIDPLQYIDSIRSIAENFGLCRIVPPSTFKPECKVIDEMRFMAYNQYVHKMLYRWGSNVKQMMAIKKYLASQNIALTHSPWIGGIEVDLPKLYQTVQQCGGLKEVIEKERWHRVADLMKIPKSAQERITKLDDIYCKYLLPYDMLSKGEREILLEQIEKEWKSYSKSHQDRKGIFNDAEECITKGRTMPLSSFYRIARNTMMMHFGAMESEDSNLVDTIEEEYWSHVSNRNSHVCVNFGSIDCGTHGYGFPITKNSPCAKHPWNLKVLTNNGLSVIRSLGPIIGVTVPTLHVNMLYSACCWYRDPHGLPWIEYVHTGASKIWYGIPHEYSNTFKEAMLSIAPQFCRDKKLWLPSDTVMIPPPLLLKHKVPLSRIVQHPGQFIVVFPKAFTSTISTGYMVSESVYFAHSSWLTIAEEIFKDLHESSEPSVISLQQLLMSIVTDTKTNISVLQQVLPMLSNMRDCEVALRSQLEELGLRASERLIIKKKRKSTKSALDDEDNYECSVCRANLFLSFVINSHEQSNYCLHDVANLLYKKQNQVKYCKLMYAYTEDELEEVIVKVKDRIGSKKLKKP